MPANEQKFAIIAKYYDRKKVEITTIKQKTLTDLYSVRVFLPTYPEPGSNRHGNESTGV